MMNIKFLDLQQNYDTISEEVNANIQTVLNKCNYIHGTEVTEFENNFVDILYIYFFVLRMVQTST